MNMLLILHRKTLIDLDALFSLSLKKKKKKKPSANGNPLQYSCPDKRSLQSMGSKSWTERLTNNEVLTYLQHQVIDSDINTSKIMEVTLLWRYCGEEFMNSLHKISLSIYNALSIVAGPCNTVWSELSLKLMKFKLQGPSLALNATSSGRSKTSIFTLA